MLILVQNHTVTQSTFDQPCVPLANSKPGSVGFFSGFMPTKAGDMDMPIYTIQINDTKPIWYYCSQGKHCQMGMVGAINAVAGSGKDITKFTQMAAMAPQNLAPGQMGMGNMTMSSAAPPATTTSVISSPSTLATTTAAATTVSVAPASTSILTAGASGVAGSRTVYIGCAVAGLLSAFLAVSM
jgi:hypothetical protein